MVEPDQMSVVLKNHLEWPPRAGPEGEDLDHLNGLIHVT